MARRGDRVPAGRQRWRLHVGAGEPAPGRAVRPGVQLPVQLHGRALRRDQRHPVRVRITGLAGTARLVPQDGDQPRDGSLARPRARVLPGARGAGADHATAVDQPAGMCDELVALSVGDRPREAVATCRRAALTRARRSRRGAARPATC